LRKLSGKKDVRGAIGRRVEILMDEGEFWGCPGQLFSPYEKGRPANGRIQKKFQPVSGAMRKEENRSGLCLRRRVFDMGSAFGRKKDKR